VIVLRIEIDPYNRAFDTRAQRGKVAVYLGAVGRFKVARVKPENGTCDGDADEQDRGNPRAIHFDRIPAADAFSELVTLGTSCSSLAVVAPILVSFIRQKTLRSGSRRRPKREPVRFL
jgi:hypothetical protein